MRTQLRGALLLAHAFVLGRRGAGPTTGRDFVVQAKPEPPIVIRLHDGIERHREPWRRKNRRGR